MINLVDIDIAKLFSLIEIKDYDAIAQFVAENNLEIIDGKIFPKNTKDCSDAIKYWDKKQLVIKINLNSLYGALLNPGCRFQDHRIGQSTTLTGRIIAKHMDAFINECITGKYEHDGEAIVYGDSVTGDTLIKTDDGEVTIANLYNQCIDRCIVGDKEYGSQSFAKVVGFNAYEDSPIMSEISYVMRHKTKKKIYRLTMENGKSLKVTEDHSVMVDRDGFLIEVKPTEILPEDLIICLIG